MAVTVYMAYLGASSSWQYYLTVDECLAFPTAPTKDRMRINGTIVRGSLDINSDRTEATFSLKGTDQNLRVICSGELPDNLAEGLDVVVEGCIDEPGHLQGDKVLTRCASKYSSQDRIASTRNSTDTDRRGR
jgi:cytochrome c-type biogenesis protein CcmE